MWTSKDSIKHVALGVATGYFVHALLHMRGKPLIVTLEEFVTDAICFLIVGLILAYFYKHRAEYINLGPRVAPPDSNTDHGPQE